jgi:DNA invertase Pin-like site-specific DNA recombinase
MRHRSVETGDLIAFLNEIHAAGVDLYLHVQGFDTSTPAGKAMFQMLGVFAEFERSLIRERVMAGLARARKHGTKSGRPCGRPKIDPATEVLIREALAKGDKGLHKIAAEHRVGTGTVQRIKADSPSRSRVGDDFAHPISAAKARQVRAVTLMAVGPPPH